MSVLELTDITKHYLGSPPVKALDGVTLSIDRGALLAIVGASGSGKSTLLNIMGTLDRPTSGQAFVDDLPVATMSDAALAGVRSTRIGFVFQQFHLLEGASAVANVATGLLYRGTNPRERRARATDALQRVGLGHRVDHKASKLSGGERQRVAIARAIVGQPAIVLADEPTGNLDSRTSEAIVDLLHDLNADGTTIAVITHDQDLADTMPRQVTLRDGKIVGDSAVPATHHEPAAAR